MNPHTLRRHVTDGAKALRLPLTSDHVDLLVGYVIGQAQAAAPVPRALPQQRHAILIGIARGESCEETGRRLGLSAHTVKTHRRLLYRQLRVRNGAQAVAAGYSRGILRAPSGSTPPVGGV